MTKPISPEEFARIVIRTGWTPARLAELTGTDLSGEITDPDQIRCLRALALDAELRSLVEEWRKFFRGLQMVAVRQR